LSSSQIGAKEAALVVARELSAEFVREARDLAAFLDLVGRGARLDEREHRHGDAALVHVFERHLGRPLERGARAAAADFVEIAGVHEVVMDIDAVRFAYGLLRTLRHQPSRQQGGGAERDERPEKAAPRRAAGTARIVRIFGVVVLRSDAHGPPPLNRGD